VPAALAADWLASAWDQNAGLHVGGPAAAVVEEVCVEWLRELPGLPEGASAAFVTGCQMAHVTALAAARLHVLRAAGWDVNGDGLAGSPPIRVLAGDLRHVTVDRALRPLGIGASSIVAIPTDEWFRMRPDALRAALARGDGPTIVVAQAGEVNTSAFDPLEEIADACEETGAWLHVDGAFGLWAAASPRLAHLVAGSERADSWATDAHK
jgi:glutamate/tyrosine decarboxylase-like PLP-dependent enzyme